MKGLEEIRSTGGNFLDGRLMEVMARDMESVFEQIHGMGVESRQMHQRVTANLEANDQQFKAAVEKNDTELKSQMQENDRQLKEAIMKNDLELKRAIQESDEKFKNQVEAMFVRMDRGMAEGLNRVREQSKEGYNEAIKQMINNGAEMTKHINEFKNEVELALADMNQKIEDTAGVSQAETRVKMEELRKSAERALDEMKSKVLEADQRLKAMNEVGS